MDQLQQLQKKIINIYILWSYILFRKDFICLQIIKLKKRVQKKLYHIVVILDLRFKKEEIKNLGPFYEDCLDFKENVTLSINGASFHLDKYGEILGDTSEYIGKNILEIPELKDNIWWLYKQILVSKIYQAVYSRINYKYGKKIAQVFEVVNEDYIHYEEELKIRIKDLSLPAPVLVRTKSHKMFTFI